MKCPFCGKVGSQVLESRAIDEGTAIRRRRKCEHCHKRFTTHERTKATVLWVIKKDGRREPFDKEKIKRGILRAIQKRPISLEKVGEIADQIEREMLKKESEEVNSKQIGSAVLKKLRRVDNVAWLRFASVYMEFDDLTDFEKLINKT